MLMYVSHADFPSAERSVLQCNILTALIWFYGVTYRFRTAHFRAEFHAHENTAIVFATTLRCKSFLLLVAQHSHSVTANRGVASSSSSSSFEPSVSSWSHHHVAVDDHDAHDNGRRRRRLVGHQDDDIRDEIVELVRRRHGRARLPSADRTSHLRHPADVAWGARQRCRRRLRQSHGWEVGSYGRVARRSTGR